MFVSKTLVEREVRLAMRREPCKKRLVEIKDRKNQHLKEHNRGKLFTKDYRKARSQISRRDVGQKASESETTLDGAHVAAVTQNQSELLLRPV